MRRQDSFLLFFIYYFVSFLLFLFYVLLPITSFLFLSYYFSYLLSYFFFISFSCPLLGKQMKEVAAAITALTKQQVIAFMEEGEMTVCGFRLTKVRNS